MGTCFYERKHGRKTEKHTGIGVLWRTTGSTEVGLNMHPLFIVKKFFNIFRIGLIINYLRYRFPQKKPAPQSSVMQAKNLHVNHTLYYGKNVPITMGGSLHDFFTFSMKP
ncbi:MAG: hypothetical protein E3K37_01895 [Candidatus Kuenenia sp.]|nr:hypothetical protein [Candidatus Kuenenia hertensis]